MKQVVSRARELNKFQNKVLRRMFEPRKKRMEKFK
jgi:hypothetical protein